MLHPDASRGWNASFFFLCDLVCHIAVRFADSRGRRVPVPGGLGGRPLLRNLHRADALSYCGMLPCRAWPWILTYVVFILQCDTVFAA